MKKSTIFLLVAIAAFAGGVVWYNNQKNETTR